MPRDRDDKPTFPRGGRGQPGRGKAGPGKGRAKGPPRSGAKFGENRPTRKPFAKKPFDPAAKRPDSKRGEERGATRDARPRSFGTKKIGDKPPRRSAPDRGPRKDFGQRPERSGARSDAKPWRSRGEADKPRSERPRGDRPAARPSRDDAPAFRSDRPRQDRPRQERGDGPRSGRPQGKRTDRVKFDRPKPDRPKFDRPRGETGDRPQFKRPRDERGARPQSDRPKFDRPKSDRPRSDRPTFDRPRGERPPRSDWQEHPRSERPAGAREERPRRDNEDDRKIFAKRPAFGGRGAYRGESNDARPPRPAPARKQGERIAKMVARAGLCSRRDAEDWITQGRVAVNGRVINSPALDVTTNDVVTIDGKPLPERERTRLFLYHKPRGLMTTHADPEGRPTVFEHLPDGLPRLISVGRLDFNTEGLLLLTNDGGLARTLELPDTGWLRRYRVRAHGDVTQAQLDQLKHGVEIEGIKYGEIDATLDRDQGANVWLVFAIREGKNREVRNVLAHLGLDVNRLIRISYGPFQLGELAEGQVEEVKTRVLREQLGERIAAASGADFGRMAPSKGDGAAEPAVKKPRVKRGAIEDRKGRRVVVQRAGSEESRARNDAEAKGYGPPRRPKRGYHGKRDFTPRDA